MSPIPPMAIALAGLRDNLLRFEKTATRLARNPPGPEMARDLVELNRVEYGVGANVAIVRAADEMIGTLLDVLR